MSHHLLSKHAPTLLLCLQRRWPRRCRCHRRHQRCWLIALRCLSLMMSQELHPYTWILLFALRNLTLPSVLLVLLVLLVFLRSPSESRHSVRFALFSLFYWFFSLPERVLHSTVARSLSSHIWILCSVVPGRSHIYIGNRFRAIFPLLVVMECVHKLLAHWYTWSTLGPILTHCQY